MRPAPLAARVKGAAWALSLRGGPNFFSVCGSITPSFGGRGSAWPHFRSRRSAAPRRRPRGGQNPRLAKGAFGEARAQPIPPLGPTVGLRFSRSGAADTGWQLRTASPTQAPAEAAGQSPRQLRCWKAPVSEFDLTRRDQVGISVQSLGRGILQHTDAKWIHAKTWSGRIEPQFPPNAVDALAPHLNPTAAELFANGDVAEREALQPALLIAQRHKGVRRGVSLSGAPCGPNVVSEGGRRLRGALFLPVGGRRAAARLRKQ